MAETNPNADVNIKVGAEADISGATGSILSEFETMEARLKRVGTEEAKALAKQLEAVTKGLRVGAFKADDVEAVAIGFAEIKEDAQLSDKAINDFARKLSDSIGRSRQLSDHMSRTSRESSRATDAIKSASDFLDGKMSPAMQKVSSGIGAVVQKLPSVQSLLSKVPALAGGIGVAFKAALVVVEQVGNAINETNRAVRDWHDRRMGIRAENAQNDYTNTIAAYDLADKKRKQALADTQALADAEKEIEDIKARTAMHDKMVETPYSRERGFIEKNEQKKAEERTLNREDERITANLEENTAEKTSLEGRRDALNELINKKQEQLDNLFNKLNIAEKDRSSFGEYAEMLDTGVIDKSLMEYWKAKTTDLGKSIMSSLGFTDYSPAEADAEMKKVQDEIRRLNQDIKQNKQSVKDIGADIEANEQRKRNLETQQQKNDASKAELESRFKAEAKAIEQERDERIATKKFEIAGQGNRLTAMGLGGGNVIGVEKELSDNMKTLAEVAKEAIQAYNRKSIAGGNSFNGPHLVPERTLGDWGQLGWQ